MKAPLAQWWTDQEIFELALGAWAFGAIVGGCFAGLITYLVMV